MRTQDLFKFIHERHAIYTRRKLGVPKPWTNDAILRKYRFCNVYRELDTVTQWIRIHWRQRHYNNSNVWFAMAVARFVNWPDTLAALTYPIPWNPERFVRVVNSIVEHGEKAYTGAYMIHTDSTSATKAEYLAHKVLTPLWDARKVIESGAISLNTFCAALLPHECLGSFMAGQIIADTKHTALLWKAPDWWTWAAIGPGSARGINRVNGSDLKAKWAEAGWLQCVGYLRKELDPLMRSANMPRLCAQDLQNCLCEFDKYERVRLGEGKPRSLYPGE